MIYCIYINITSHRSASLWVNPRKQWLFWEVDITTLNCSSNAKYSANRITVLKVTINAKLTQIWYVQSIFWYEFLIYLNLISRPWRHKAWALHLRLRIRRISQWKHIAMFHHDTTLNHVIGFVCTLQSRSHRNINSLKINVG